MEFRFPPFGEPPPPPQYWPQHPPPLSGYGDLSELATRAGYGKPWFLPGNDYFSQGTGHINEYFGQGIGQANEIFQNINNVHQKIQRELEKKRIRDEIIAEEFIRRQILEAEVRAELRMERELALRLRGGNAFDRYLVPWGAGMLKEPREISFLQEIGGLSFEDRVAMYAEERLRMQARCETQGIDTPFQRRGVESKVKEATPSHLQSGSQKEKIVFLAVPGAHLSGTKKVTSPAKESEKEHVCVGNKKEKKEWSCVICQVSTPNERDLNHHFLGKKHKSKEAALLAERNGSNIGFGVLPSKTEKPIIEATCIPSPPQWLKVGGEVLQINPSVPSSMHIVATKGLDEKTVSLLPENEKPKLKKELSVPKSKEMKSFTFWCDICQVGAYDEMVMEGHRKGKKHLKLLQKTKEIDQANLTTQIAGSQVANDADEATTEDNKAFDNVDRTTNEAHVQNQDVNAIEEQGDCEAKPCSRLSGTKKKEVSLAKENENELLGVGNRKGKKEWSCVICQVSTTSEHGLNDHFLGKKHKFKEAALAERKGSNIGVAFLPKKTEEYIIEVTHVSSPPQVQKAGGEAPQINQSEPSLLHIVPTQCLDEESVTMLPENEKKDTSMKEKKTFTFYCTSCQVRAYNEISMEQHRKGKKHLKLHPESREIDQANNFSTSQIVGSQGANIGGEATKEGDPRALGDVDRTTNEEHVENQDVNAIEEGDYEAAKGVADTFE